ncbi:glycoside hydrolase family 99-like domain-containing protein [Mucilaginibacter sp.]|uniref:glycosyltransferase WbsX family protein n=1 Tax=Mucilaginibacter sp. TaxID=1882438 RepID=UPI0035BC5385
MIKPIAIHLPQFHPFPENDEWWGKGFTEWTNVAKARPLFKGHYQPHLPADLGFYDLRLAEARLAQAELAKQYGIHGFCYYHYWFNGKRLLNQPVDAILQSGEPDFPFMLCWANENWTRRWDGEDQEILMQQNYSEADDVAHIQFLLNSFFTDPRYIRVNNKPFFVVYKPLLFPDIQRTLSTWRAEAAKVGVELYLGYMKASSNDKNTALLSGFDCSIDFQPHQWDIPVDRVFPLSSRIKSKLGMQQQPHLINRVYSYPQYVNEMVKLKADTGQNAYPGITPGWDNSARRKKDAVIFDGSTPQEYGRWLDHLATEYKGRDTYLFINAWNEWAEGNHLEPDARWGRQYLEQTAKSLKNG